MSALLDDNSVILTDFQNEGINQLKEIMDSGNFLALMLIVDNEIP